MRKNKEIEALPYFESEEQKQVGLTKDSFVAILATTEDTTEVFYYNPGVKSIPDIDEASDQPMTFEEFCEYIQEDRFPFSYGDKAEKTEKPNFFSLVTSSAEEADDYDEESGKSWKVLVGKAAVLDVYKGGLTKETLTEKIKLAESSVNDAESNAQYELNDSIEYNRDPYKYYGVSRADFF